MQDYVPILKLGLLVFWALWITLVFLTNLFAGLKLLRVLPEGWRFASINYTLIQKATEKYCPPGWLNGLLFGGVIAWQGIQVGLFWWAVVVKSMMATDLAFGVSLGLWAAFILADEVLQAYPKEGSHLEVFVAQVVSVLVMHVL